MVYRLRTPGRKYNLYTVVENTPGYLPEDDNPFRTTNLREAQSWAAQLARELVEQGYCRTGGSAVDGLICLDWCDYTYSRVIEIIAEPIDHIDFYAFKHGEWNG